MTLCGNNQDLCLDETSYKMVENDLIYSQLCDALNGNDVDQMLTLLRKSDVNIDHRDVTHDLQTFLMRVCYIYLETSDLLLVLEAIFNLKPDVNIQDSWGRTVLMHSCIANKPVLIEGLLEYDVTDVSVIDFDGNSALTYAVQNCDVYTVEDILQHNLGPSLIQVHNAKGHSPYIIAEKAKNQTLLQLFDEWLSKTSARERNKSRKPRNRDVRAIKLPPAYSPSPERKCRNSPPNKVAPLNISPVSQCNKNIKISARDSSEESYSERSEKSNSGDFIQSNGKDEILNTLSLSSPRLTRRHHKQDCLLQETLLLNQSRHFPHMKSLKRNESKERALALPEYSLRNQRRPSLSLPDLRNVSGFLVNSGSSTPTTEGDESERKFTRLKDYSDDDNDYDSNGNDDENDEVFSKSYPNSANTARCSISIRSGKSNVTLPDINSGKTTTAFPNVSRKGVIPLSRRRKFSNSDDQIHRSSGIENVKDNF